MLKSVLALIAAAALPAAASSQTPSETGGWDISRSGGACMATSASPEGTVVSILAAPTDNAFVFLVQNPAWQTLEDGNQYPLAVEFDEMGPWQVEASAREEIDSDGPGLAFFVAPGRPDGNGFIQELVNATSMEIATGGETVTQVSIDGSQEAMEGLASCLASSWAGVEDPAGESAAVQTVSGEPATPL
jgi:hypothetical protein